MPLNLQKLSTFEISGTVNCALKIFLPDKRRFESFWKRNARLTNQEGHCEARFTRPAIWANLYVIICRPISFSVGEAWGEKSCTVTDFSRVSVDFCTFFAF